MRRSTQSSDAQTPPTPNCNLIVEDVSIKKPFDSTQKKEGKRSRTHCVLYIYLLFKASFQEHHSPVSGSARVCVCVLLAFAVARGLRGLKTDDTRDDSNLRWKTTPHLTVLSAPVCSEAVEPFIRFRNKFIPSTSAPPPLVGKWVVGLEIEFASRMLSQSTVSSLSLSLSVPSERYYVVVFRSLRTKYAGHSFYWRFCLKHDTERKERLIQFPVFFVFFPSSFFRARWTFHLRAHLVYRGFFVTNE